MLNEGCCLEESWPFFRVDKEFGISYIRKNVYLIDF